PLEISNLVEREMTLHCPDPAALRQDHGYGFFLDHRRPVDVARCASFLNLSPSLVAELVAYLPEVGFEPLPLQILFGNKADELLALARERRSLAANLHLLELAQAPEAHVENGLGLSIR